MYILQTQYIIITDGNESTMNATAVYNGENYYFIIVQKTGAIKSVEKR